MARPYSTPLRVTCPGCGRSMLATAYVDLDMEAVAVPGVPERCPCTRSLRDVIAAEESALIDEAKEFSL